MDTKSNGIKYSYGMKVTAVLLAAVCVFSSAWCCVYITKMLRDYGWENLLVRENAKFTDTVLFYDEVGEAADAAYTAKLSGTWEEKRTKEFGTLEEEQDYALQAFRKFRASEEAYAVSHFTESVTDASGAPVETTTYAASSTDSSFAYSFTKEGKNYLAGRTSQYSLFFFPETTMLFYYDMTEEEVLQDVERTYTTRLTAERRLFESNVVIATERLSKYENFKFLAVNSATGEAYSNCQAKTPDAFYAMCDTNLDWVLGYTAERGVEYYSDAVSTDSLYETELQNENYVVLPDFLGNTFAQKGFDVYLCVSLPLTADANDAFYAAQKEFETNTARLAALLFAAMILLAAALLLSIYLVLVTGRVRGVAGVQMSVLDRIPTDLHLVVSWGLAICGFVVAARLLDVYVFQNNATYYIRSVSLLCLGIALLYAAIYVVLLEWCTSVAKYQKAKKSFLLSMLTAKIFLWIFKGCKSLCKWIKNGITKAKNLFKYSIQHLSKKAWLYVLLYILANAAAALLFAANGITLFTLLCIAAVNIIALALVWRYVQSLDRIIDAAEKSKSGESIMDFSAENMPEPLRSLAQNLTYTQEEMQKAVQEAIKGERLKTELITNVSHDLKTPLTSIISYVDLLKKCDIQNTDAQKYISVLDEKSIRLKRLIEDLVEASKASSGAVTLNKMQVNLYELATQAVGEMEDGFAERNLQLVLNEPKEVPVIFADSQKTWRVIDNLLSNARKYSLAGSRVYVTVERCDDFGTFTVKNVSGEALNIGPDELTQRFVRGDASRTLEGSGLGLSIAKDLCALQGGELKIEIDGDLFKATVSLPLWKAGDLPQMTNTPSAPKIP